MARVPEVGILKWQRLEAFSIGPVLKSEATILFPLVASMLIPCAKLEVDTSSCFFLFNFYYHLEIFY